MPLVFAPVNVLLRVVKMHVDEKLKRHLENLGISVNSELEVLSQSGGSVICRIKDGRLALDRDMATRIFVAVRRLEWSKLSTNSTSGRAASSRA